MSRIHDYYLLHLPQTLTISFLVWGGIGSAGIWESEYLILESSIIAICPISYVIFTVLEVGSTECKRHLPDLWAKILQLFLSSAFLLCSLAHSLVQTLLVHSTGNLGLILDSSLFSPSPWKQYHKPTRHIINLWLTSQYIFTLLPLHVHHHWSMSCCLYFLPV